jgi:hypothetical protein
MSSSTSNSEPTSLAAALGHLLASWPQLVVAAALLLVTALARLSNAAGWPALLDDIVFRAQAERALRISRFDLLVVGDSSGLTGVDPTWLGQLMGRRVEILSTMAVVGPVGHSLLATRALPRGAPEASIVFSMNALGVQQDGKTFPKWEGLLDATRQRERLVEQPAAIRDWGFKFASEQVFHLPLPGSYGRAYGWPRDLVEHVEREHGSMADPNRLTQCPDTPIHFKLSAAVTHGLGQFREALSRFPGLRLELLVTPSPAPCVSADFEGERARALADVLPVLGLTEDEVLSTPHVLPIEMFATATHLNPLGRARLTQAMASSMWPGPRR